MFLEQGRYHLRAGKSIPPFGSAMADNPSSRIPSIRRGATGSPVQTNAAQRSPEKNNGPSIPPPIRVHPVHLRFTLFRDDAWLKPAPKTVVAASRGTANARERLHQHPPSEDPCQSNDSGHVPRRRFSQISQPETLLIPLFGRITNENKIARALDGHFSPRVCGCIRCGRRFSVARAQKRKASFRSRDTARKREENIGRYAVQISKRASASEGAASQDRQVGTWVGSEERRASFRSCDKAREREENIGRYAGQISKRASACEGAAAEDRRIGAWVGTGQMKEEPDKSRHSNSQ